MFTAFRDPVIGIAESCFFPVMSTHPILPSRLAMSSSSDQSSYLAGGPLSDRPCVDPALPYTLLPAPGLDTVQSKSARGRCCAVLLSHDCESRGLHSGAEHP